MDSKKALMAVVTVLGVIASAYLFLQGKIAFEEYSHLEIKGSRFGKRNRTIEKRGETP